MKVAYIISSNSDKLDGVGNKVVGQISAWCKLGVDVRILNYAARKGSAFDHLPGWKFGMRAPCGCRALRIPKLLFQYLRGLVLLLIWRPDIIYARAGYRPFGCWIWPLLSKKVILEVNSNLVKELDSYLEKGLRSESEVSEYIEIWKMSLRRCDGMVSVSYQMDEVNKPFLGDKPHVVVWNTIDFEKTESIPRSNQDNTLPKLVFIGSTDYAWNGLDLLKSFAESTIGQLEFVVIGASDDGSFPENMEVQPYVEHTEMINLLAGCDIGLGPLAPFRKGLDEYSTLKVGDYATLGMPMILSYKETPFVGGELPEWVLEIENNATSLQDNKKSIIDFCNRWRGSSFNREEAKPYLESSLVESKRVEFFERVLKGNEK